MKTNNLYITLFAALAITACGKDNELPQGSAKDPNADMPDAYTSIAINIPHTTMTKAASGRAIDQGIADERSRPYMYLSTIPMPQILRQLPNLR